MEIRYPALLATRRTGDELFHDAGACRGFSICDFWRWAASDLVGNVLRGRLAEYLVAQALGVADGQRAEWHPFDLQASDGVTIEVKSAAYLQSWGHQRLSRITFDIGPKRFWDPITNEMATVAERHAKVYVFALLEQQDKQRLDPTDLAQWRFFVLATRTLNDKLPRRKSINLAALKTLNPRECGFDGIAECVRQTVAQMHGS